MSTTTIAAATTTTKLLSSNLGLATRILFLSALLMAISSIELATVFFLHPCSFRLPQVLLALLINLTDAVPVITVPFELRSVDIRALVVFFFSSAFYTVYSCSLVGLELPFVF